MNKRTTAALLFAAGLATQHAPLAAPQATIVVCYPGGTASEVDANAAMASMLRVVERVGQWPANRFTSSFSSEMTACRQLLSSQHPAFMITPLGVFLERRTVDHLVPLVQPRMNGRTSERYRIVVRKGSFADLASLKGHSLGGTVLEDRDLIARVVLGGKVDLASFELRPSKQGIRSLRALDRGELDAVLLNEQQFSALGLLQLSTPLEVIFSSDEIPLIGVVANSSLSDAEERGRFAKALEGMCGDPEGKRLCDLFGVEAFVAADPHAFDQVVGLWGEAGS